MTIPSEHEQHDYITNSVAGLVTLVIIATGLVMTVAWFRMF